MKEEGLTIIKHSKAFISLLLVILLSSIPFSVALELQNPLSVNFDFEFLNLYDKNNPYKYVDPSGESPVFAILRGAIAAARPAFSATVNLVKTYGPRALAYFGAGYGYSSIEQLSETGTVNQKQAVTAGVGSAAGGTVGNVLVSTPGLPLSSFGKEAGKLVIAEYSSEVSENVFRNVQQGRPALENSGNVDPDTFIRNVVVSTALGTALPSSGGFNEQSLILPNQYSSQTSLNRAQFSTANNQHSNQNRASSTRQIAWKNFSNRSQSRRNRR